MLFSLDQPVAKNQMSAEVFCCRNHNLKREKTTWPIFFLECHDNNSWQLLFSIWFLVTG